MVNSCSDSFQRREHRVRLFAIEQSKDNPLKTPDQFHFCFQNSWFYLESRLANLFEPRKCTSLQQPNLWAQASESNGADMEQITQEHSGHNSLDMERSKQGIKNNCWLCGDNDL